MDKKELIEQAKQLIKHVQEHPEELKKVQKAPEAPPLAKSAPAPKPAELKPYFLSQDRANKIMDLAKSMAGKKMPESKPQAQPAVAKEEKAPAGKDMPNTLPQEKPAAGKTGDSSAEVKDPGFGKDEKKESKEDAKDAKKDAKEDHKDKKDEDKEKEDMEKAIMAPAAPKPPMQMNVPPVGPKPKMPGSMHLPKAKV